MISKELLSVSQELNSCLVYYLAVVKIATVGGGKKRKIVNALVCVACPRYYCYHFLIIFFLLMSRSNCERRKC